MVGLTLLRDAERAGLVVSSDGDRLVVRGPRRAESLARKLIANKDVVLAFVSGRLPPEWYVEWDERAAIMEFDGGLPREHAEALALADILRLMEEASAPRT